MFVSSQLYTNRPYEIIDAIGLWIPIIKSERKCLIKYQKDLKKLQEPFCWTFWPFIIELPD